MKPNVRGHLPPDDLRICVNDSEKNLGSLENARILICGATGFVGTWLTSVLLEANSLLNLNLQISVISRDPIKASKILNVKVNDNLNIYKADLIENIASIIKNKSEYSHIVHAAVDSTRLDSNLDSNQQNLKVTKSILDFAHTLTKPPVLLHTSSGAVYGPQPLEMKQIQELPFERIQFGELTNYGRSKREIEVMIQRATAKGTIKGSNPRLFTFMGPRIPMDKHYAAGNFLRDAMKGEPILLNGNSKTTRSYLYPTDLVEWLIAVLASPLIDPIHIGSEIPIEMKKLAEVISKTTSSCSLRLLGESIEPSNYVPSTYKTRMHYSLRERVALHEGIRKWESWLQEIA